MGTKATILISGLALFYLRDPSTWQVTFLCDDNHRLIFTDGSGTSIELGGKQTIEFKVTDPAVPGANKNNNGNSAFKHIFNIVADAHPRGVDLVEPIAPTPTPGNPPHRHKVSMTVEHATVGNRTFTNRIYGRRPETSTGPYTALRRVSKVVMAEIDLNPGGRLEMFVDGQRQNLQVLNNMVLKFDNDCRPLASPACSSVNDSLLFYELIRGREVPPVRYVFGRVHSPNGMKLLSHPDGNCDPISSDPPPGP